MANAPHHGFRDPEAVLTGVEEMQRNLDRVGVNVKDDVPKALFQMAQIIMGRSKKSFVPVQGPGKKGNRNPAGALRASGHVEKPKFKGRNVEVALVYGGPSAPYAAAIHNHPSGASPPSWNGKTLKFYLGGDRTGYLSKPLMEAAPTLARELGVRIHLDR